MVTRRPGFPAIVVLLGFAALIAGCEKVPLLAPSGSTITLTTATTAVGFNGTADIIAQVIEPAGTPPHSGTHITFTTSLGTIQPSEVQTDLNGRATARFVAGSSSGIATITAISGGASVAAGSALKILVGSAAVGAVVASANPSTVSSSGGTATISAQVTDAGGNSLGGIPVTFTTDAGSVNPSVASTNPNGIATAVLTTNKTAIVTVAAGVATTSTSADGKTTTTAPATSKVTVTVNSTGSITIGTPTPASPQVGQTVSFSLTYPAGTTGASPITRVNVDWGDGRSNSFTGAPPSISHAYSSTGSYLVTVVGFDAFGDTSTAAASVTVVSRPQPTVSISASANPQPNTPVTFTIAATASTGNSISSVTVDFGDGSVQTLAGNTTSVQHVYATAGTYRVTATATDTSGESGSASTVIVLGFGTITVSYSISPSPTKVLQTTSFNGSDSTGPNPITDYAFDFGDGTSASGSNPAQTHIYTAAGTYTTRLTVTDNQGRTATKAIALTVNP